MVVCALLDWFRLTQRTLFFWSNKSWRYGAFSWNFPCWCLEASPRPSRDELCIHHPTLPSITSRNLAALQSVDQGILDNFPQDFLQTMLPSELKISALQPSWSKKQSTTQTEQQELKMRHSGIRKSYSQNFQRKGCYTEWSAAEIPRCSLTVVIILSTSCENKLVSLRMRKKDSANFSLHSVPTSIQLMFSQRQNLKCSNFGGKAGSICCRYSISQRKPHITRETWKATQSPQG